MKKISTSNLINRVILLLIMIIGLACFARADESAHSIALPGVEGRIDHMFLDKARQQLFVCALGNNTVEVIDLKAGKVCKTLTGCSEPQGVCFITEFNLLFVANGGSGKCNIYDGSTFDLLSALDVGDDADNVRYDVEKKLVLVGYGSGALAFIDPKTKQIISTIALGAHPESFQIDPAHSRAFVNVPNSHSLAIVDLDKKQVVANYALGFNAANFPMALDETHHLLFVGCRLPSHLLIYNTQTGQQVSSLDLHGDCDDLFYDSSHELVYASCGQGYLDVFSAASGKYSLKKSIPTASGARTSQFDGTTLFLAFPHRGDQAAAIKLLHPVQ